MATPNAHDDHIHCEDCGACQEEEFLHFVLDDLDKEHVYCMECCDKVYNGDCPHTCEDGCKLALDHIGLCEVG